MPNNFNNFEDGATHPSLPGKTAHWLDQFRTYGRMIKFSHTIFALPFALSAVILAWRSYPIRWDDIIWILVAMIGARSAAMGFNRIADARIDGKNPRTRMREIPTDLISTRAALLFVIGFAGLFIFAAAMLGKLCFYLSFPVLGILFAYSYTKRFTWLCHLYLGFAISLAPLAVWIALTKHFSGPILLLSSALWTYIAGFDILYACQDIAFDRKEGLHSIPARFGVARALWMAAGLHAIAFASFAALHPAFGMNGVYLVTVLIIGLLLIAEHRLVNPQDLSRIHVAFFHMNSIISAVLFVGILADELMRRWV